MCVILKHKNKAISTSAQIFPTSHRFCFLQLQITNCTSTEICGAKLPVHLVYGAKGGCWSEIDWSHSQSEERGFCPTANQRRGWIQHMVNYQQQRQHLLLASRLTTGQQWASLALFCKSGHVSWQTSSKHDNLCFYTLAPVLVVSSYYSNYLLRSSQP